ncbi:MAG TPA: nucleoside phosphorylase [Candidatus Tectomicrobia bacterium]
MMLTHFLSLDSPSRIEPGEFVAHALASRGLEPASFGLQQTVLMILIPELQRHVLDALGSPPPHPHRLQRQVLYNPAGRCFSTLTSPMGAPMAVLLLEQLIALGARRFLYLGFCGALATSYGIGDCFIPEQAVREEGTSYHYLPADVIPASAPRLNAILRAHASQQQLPVRQGPIWTTDAPYRETAHKIQHFQSSGVHAVDMEMAALLAVGFYRGCEVTALLIVSDECYHPTWRPGFGVPRLRQTCRAAAAVCVAAAAEMAALET